jgi:hypothetical protein
MELFAESSKQITDPRSVGYLNGTSRVLNQRSIDDLQKILAIVEEKGLGIGDAQFYFREDGSVVVGDPNEVYFGDVFWSEYTKTRIAELIAIAEKNVARQ